MKHAVPSPLRRQVMRSRKRDDGTARLAKVEAEVTRVVDAPADGQRDAVQQALETDLITIRPSEEGRGVVAHVGLAQSEQGQAPCRKYPEAGREGHALPALV